MTESGLLYVLQSGKDAGRFLAACVFKNITHWRNYLINLEKTSYKSKNKLHKSLEAIFKKITKLKIRKICPICKQRTVEFFLLRDNGGWFDPPRSNKICCDDLDCKKALQYGSGAELRPINLKAFNIKSPYGRRQLIDQTELSRVLLEVYFDINVPSLSEVPDDLLIDKLLSA